MFKWLVIFCVVAQPAMAAEAVFLYLATAGVSVGLATTLTGIIVGFGKSLLLSAVSSLFSKGRNPSSPENRAEMRVPQDLLPYRFAYGNARIPGSQWPIRVVGKVMYGCFLLNSRPSEGNFTLYLDDREVELTGDPFDFTDGGGASATNDPFTGKLKVWFGLGDQTGPPFDFTDEAGDDFDTTDGWRGLTMVFIRCDKTGVADVQELWPNFPPEVDVLGDWSLVYDPREVSHDLDDPDTWEFSRNQGLCALDSLTQNPIEKYREANLRMDLFEWAADVADEAVVLKVGGTEPRYCCDGFIVFNDSEIEDQVQPLFDAGGAQPVRIAGRLGIIPGEYVEPSLTITDMLEGGFERTVLRSSDQLPTQLQTYYTSADRNYERAPLAPYDIPGGLTADGGVAKKRDQYLDLVKSPTQAMRLRKIAGNLARAQKGITFTAPPEAFELVAGSTTTLALPAPFSAFDGIYRVSEVSPAADSMGESGVALRCPITLTEYASSFYDWTPADDEEDVIIIEFDPSRPTLAMPGALTAEFGVEVNGGDYYIVPLRITFDPSTSASVTEYEVQYAIAGGDYQDAPKIYGATKNGLGQVFGDLYAIDVTKEYKVRVRAVSGTSTSEWRELTGITSEFVLSSVSAEAVAGGAEFTATTQSNSYHFGVRIYRAETGAGFGAAVAVTEQIATAAGTSVTVLAGDITAFNLFTNHDFADGSDWTPVGNWSIGSGVATHTPAASLEYMPQSVTAEDSTDYRITYEVPYEISGAVQIRITGDTALEGTASTETGTFQEVLTTPVNVVSAGPSAKSFNGNIDNLWMVEDTPDLLTQGEADFWIVPVSTNGTEGPAVGPFTLIIY